MNAAFPRKARTAILCVSCVSLLSGCVAAMMPAIVAVTAAEGSMIYGSTHDNQFTIKLDDFLPQVREALSNTKHWAILASDTDTGHATIADELESKGLRVTLHRTSVTAKAMSATERRATLDRMCRDLASDVAIAFQQDNTKETGTYLQALLGRSENTITGRTHILNCRNRTLSSFGSTVVINHGQYSRKTLAELQEAINKDFANQVWLAFASK